jgi:hypothetical protein
VFVGINKDSSGRATFLFTHNKKCQRLVSEFSQLKALVEPIKFYASQKRLKQLLFLNK